VISSIVIKNYALIDDIKVNFDSGLTIITGETGAGKSIILGALAMLLGKRADLSSVKNPEKKCVIEGEFLLKNYKLQSFFKQEDLDYETVTFIRREILPSGKSRAFVNDTPVNLQTLSTLGDLLIDIHSQHQTLEVVSQDFQFQLIDALAETKPEISAYSALRKDFQQCHSQLKTLQAQKAAAEKELDYNNFLFKELEDANLKTGEQEELEQEFEAFNNVETIQETVVEATGIFYEEQMGVLQMLKELQLRFSKLKSFSPEMEMLWKRVQSAAIELDDIALELTKFADRVEANPERLEFVQSKLQQIYTLQKKHQVATVAELIAIKDQLDEKIATITNADFQINQLEKQLETVEAELLKTADQIHQKREKILPVLSSQLEEILYGLGLPNAKFKIQLTVSDRYLQNGKDELEFLFTANKGTAFGDLKKVASGGELSRIMLAIKSVLAGYTKLPTIVFDEIDTGVSGEIANKIADILSKMSATMQVICITHLPQIAAKGKHHIRVYKEDVGEMTATKLQLLNYDQRIVELSQMLGGKNLSDAAVAHAKALLN